MNQAVRRQTPWHEGNDTRSSAPLAEDGLL